MEQYFLVPKLPDWHAIAEAFERTVLNGRCELRVSAYRRVTASRLSEDPEELTIRSFRFADHNVGGRGRVAMSGTLSSPDPAVGGRFHGVIDVLADRGEVILQSMS